MEGAEKGTMILDYPTKYKLTSGKGVSKNELVAFDNALIDAGISNYNLLKVSSILPENCFQSQKIDLREGSPLLTAFAEVSSDKPGTHIATAVAVGIPKDQSKVGVIMEYKNYDIDADSARGIVCEMVREAMHNHGIELEEILSSSIDGIVENSFLSLISAVVMW